MRTTDFSFFVASSIVFQAPAGEADCAAAANAAPARTRPRTALERVMRISLSECGLSCPVSEESRVERHHRRSAGPGAADESGGLRQELGEIEARRRQLGRVE